MLGPADLVLTAAPLGHVPLFDRLVPARDAGFAGVAVMPTDIWALEQQGIGASEIKRRIADHGLAISEVDCTACWLPSQQALDTSSEMAALLRSMTPERGIAIAASIGARSVTAVEMNGVAPSLDEAAQAFAQVCDLAAEHRLLVHIEFLPFGGIPDLARAWAIVHAAGRANGGLTIDSWHLFRSGSTLDQLAAIPGDHIHTVQINDAPVRPQADLMHETMTNRPGEGALDLARMIRTLDRIGSTAPIGVEVFPLEQQTMPIGEIARSWAHTARSVINKSRVRL